MATESVDELDSLRKQLEKDGLYKVLIYLHEQKHDGDNCFCTTEISGAYQKLLAIIDAYYTRECARKVLEAEQKPVGAALEIKVAPETMKAVMARIRLSDKSIADRVLEPLWRVQRWRDGSADEYDLEIEQWKLRILAHLTRRFSWAAFLLKPDNLKVLKTRAELRAAIEEVGGAMPEPQQPKPLEEK